MVITMKMNLKQKVIAAILLISLVLVSIVAFISYETYSESMDEHYISLATNISKTAAVMIDTELVEKYTKIIKDIYAKNPRPEVVDEEYLQQYSSVLDDEYQELRNELELMRVANEVMSLYIISIDNESKSGVYIADPDSSCSPGLWDIVYPDNYEIIENPSKSFPAYTTNTEEYGWLASAGSAIVDEEGEVIAHVLVDISMNEIMQDRANYLYKLLIIISISTFAIIILFIFMVNRVVIKPINSLVVATGKYISDKESVEENSVIGIKELSIKTGDEIEELCDSIKHMEQDITEYISSITTITAEKERIGAELNIATDIQASMLPSIFPAFPDKKEIDIYATMTPAKEVGGDFYDFFFVDKKHLALVIADVSGKGVPAALFMVISKILIKNFAQTGIGPKEILEKTNNKLCETNEAEMFVTVWLGIINIEDGHMVCANAGHEYPTIKRANGEFEIFKDSHGFVLAGMEDLTYKEYDIQLEKDDVVFVYTDGVAEATNEDGELFGMDRTLRALNKEIPDTLEGLLKNVKSDIDEFVGNAPQFDDFTMLGFKYKGI